MMHKSKQFRITVACITVIVITYLLISCTHDPLIKPSESGNPESDASVTSGGNSGNGNTSQGQTGSDTSAYYNSRACFVRDILPIIQSNCAIPGCHDGSSSGSSSGDGESDNDRTESLFALTGYENIMEIVSPGSPSQSKLYQVITGGSEEFMPPPPQAALTSSQVDSIYNWISYGALNENCGTVVTTSGGSSGGGSVSCDTTSVTFAKTVSPLIQNYCFGCHNGPNAQKGIHLETYQDISAVASNGMLMGVIEGRSGYPLMPPAGSLSSCQIAQIQAWINQGSPNNRIAQTGNTGVLAAY